MDEPIYVDPTSLRPGPIRHDSLSELLQRRIRDIFDAIGPYLDTTLEQFELDFMRDAAPEREVLLWHVIATAWTVYHGKYLDGQRQSDAEERKLIGALLSISMGVEDVEKLGVSTETAERLVEIVDAIRRIGQSKRGT